MWGNKKETADAEPVGEVMIPPVARPAAAPVTAATATAVAAGCVVNGSITATGNVVVDGKVAGDVRCAALTIGRDGEITGNVVAETATVRGKVAGDVRARTIQLAGSGVINGDLTHAVLIIEEGGAFEGRSKRLADPLAEVPVLEAPATASDAAAPAKKARKETTAAAETPEPAAAPAAPTSSALANELGDGFAARPA
jgi:cytoskeletal protein CcmA (bactofilin family)